MDDPRGTFLIARRLCGGEKFGVPLVRLTNPRNLDRREIAGAPASRSWKSISKTCSVFLTPSLLLSGGIRPHARPRTMDIDQSLDAMIKSAPKKKGGGAGGKKKAKPGPKAKTTPGKKVGGVKTKVIAKARRGPKANAMAVDTWAHDKFKGPGPAGGTAKLIISNLHPNVTNQDIKVRTASVPCHG